MQYRVKRHEAFSFNPGFIESALRTIGAILGAVASPDAQQGRHLYLAATEVFPVHGLCPIHQIAAGQIEERAYVFPAPVMAIGAAAGWLGLAS